MESRILLLAIAVFVRYHLHKFIGEKKKIIVSIPGVSLQRAMLCDARERDIAKVPLKKGKAAVFMNGSIQTLRLVFARPGKLKRKERHP